MKLILKYTMKNILIKPLRTIIMVLCLTAVSLAFSLCFLVNSASERIVCEQIRSSTGRADIIAFSEKGFESEAAVEENVDILYVNMTRVGLQLHRIENYKYVQKKQITLLGLDSYKAYEFGLISENTGISDDEILISSAVASLFGYEKGDLLQIPCADGSEITLTIKEIIPCEGFMSIMPRTVVVTSDTANTIMCTAKGTCNTLYLDVEDDKKITEVYNDFVCNYPDANIQQIIGGTDTEEIISGITSAFFAIFAVVFLMVIFIIAGFANSIAAERMSAVGTFRSIGADKTTAAMTLLMESLIYGLLGGIIGGIIFGIIKDMVIANVIAVDVGHTGNYTTPLYIPLAGAAVTIVTCIGCSLYAVLRTAGLPVKDIIFANKETGFKLSTAQLISGLILFVAAVVLYITDFGFICNIITLMCFETGICLMIPGLLKAVSNLAGKLSQGGRFPIARLSLIQSGTKKSSVMGAVLCTAVISLMTAVFILAVSVDRLYSAHNYSSDIIITELSQKAAEYDAIAKARGITDSEMIYSTEENIQINNDTVNTVVFGYQDYRYFEGIKGLPAEIHSGEAALDGAVLRRLGISVGDNIEIILKADSVRPRQLTLKVVGECNSVYYDMRCNAVVLSMEDYKEVYYDYPSTLLLKADDANVSDRISQLLADDSAVVRTTEEYNIESESDAGSVTTALYCLIYLGMALMTISVAGNRSISFEQRKHEFAILHAVGMSKNQLMRMIMAEMAVLALISSAVSLISCGIIVKILSGILTVLELNVPICFDMGSILIFIVIVVTVIMLMSVQPIYSLVKMNTADRLKYE